MKNKSCILIGHKDLLELEIENIKGELEDNIDLAIRDGVTNFVFCYYDTFDFAAYDIVNKKRLENNNITTELFTVSKGEIFSDRVKEVMEGFTAIGFSNEYEYDGDETKRNREMVNFSDMVIAAYDGRKKGSTYEVLCFAKEKGIETKVIKIVEE